MTDCLLMLTSFGLGCGVIHTTATLMVKSPSRFNQGFLLLYKFWRFLLGRGALAFSTALPVVGKLFDEIF